MARSTEIGTGRGSLERVVHTNERDAALGSTVMTRIVTAGMPVRSAVTHGLRFARRLLGMAPVIVLAACSIDAGTPSSNPQEQCLRACGQRLSVCGESGAARNRADLLLAPDPLCESEFRQCRAQCSARSGAAPASR